MGGMSFADRRAELAQPRQAQLDRLGITGEGERAAWVFLWGVLDAEAIAIGLEELKEQMEDK